MFANRFTAIIDACVLVSAAKRDLVLSLASAELFRARWSQQVLTETGRALIPVMEKRGHTPEEAERRSQRALSNIRAAFPEAVVHDYDNLAGRLDCLPDQNDHHVLAAAIICKASVIVTDNLKHFPANAVGRYEIEAKPADEFIADAIDLDYGRSIAAVSSLRRKLKNPELTPAELLERWRLQGLELTADLLYPHLNKI